MVQNAKGPAAIAVAPSHGSTNPTKDQEMNTTIPITPSPAPQLSTGLTRRFFLGGAAALATPTAALALPAAEPSFDLQAWLNTADLDAVAHYHAAHLAEVMGRMDAARVYRSKIDVKYGFALITGDPKKRPAPVAKVYVDDGSPFLADDVTSTTAFADWEAAR